MDNPIYYKESIMSMPVGYGLHKIVLDANGHPCDYEFIEVNQKFEEITGTAASDITGRRVSEVIPGFISDAFDWIGAYGSVAVNGTVLNSEQYSDYLKKWLRVNAFCPEKGYFVTLLSDITKDKNESGIAYETEKKLKNHLDFAPLGIIVVNKAGKLLEVNPEACRISGYAELELLATNLQRLIARSSRIIALMFFKDLLNAGEAECQMQIKTKQGELLWLQLNARTISSGFYTLYCQDITSYKNLEDDLVKSELLYRTYINASDDIIYLKDESLRYIIVNNALLDQFESESSDIIGRTDDEALPEEFANQTRGSDLEAVETKASTVSEMMIDGKTYEAVKFPVPIGNRQTGVGAYIRDISEEKRKEDILKRTMERHRILANALLMTFQNSQEQLEYALQEALTLTGSQYGYIFLYDDERREMTLNCWTKGVLEACRISDVQNVYPLDQTGLWGEVIRHRKPLILNDYSKPSRVKKGFPPGHIDVRNFMSIPVILNDRVVAAVGLANKHADYDDFDVYELTMLMNGVWVAVEKQNVQNRMENLLEQTQAMFNEHDAVMLLIQPETGRIIDANPAAVSFYGYTKEELLNLQIDDINMFNNDEEKELHYQVYDKKQKYYSFPHRLKNGEKRMVDVYSCPISYNNEKVLFSIIFDVTEREEAFDEIKYLSFHDHLTGLYNRRYFDNVLKLMNDERFMPLTIVMADVNGLKLVNDSFGHTEGDALLIKAAEIITEGCRKDDVSARIGGDEFVIILPNTDNNEAGKIVRRIKKLQSKVKIRQLNLSLSFGFAVKHNVSSDIELIVSEAENKMYKNKMHESASTRNKTVNIILKTLYEKCIGELEHSNRVSRSAAAIATEMGLSPEQISQIGVAGLLHDIGKIGVDDSVLNKQGVFTKADREEIEKHSESGWRILSNSDEYSNLADYVLYHHESIDGKGYPRGIKGDSIPLVSKIINVCDAYDAMTNDRPYRTAKSREEAVEELKRLSGAQFDPAVVNVFINKVLSGDNNYEI
jgi:diguanylate cyclase